jgi:hypothetical protein
MYMKSGKSSLRSWVVSVDMGLGHQRAVSPFAPIAEEGIMTIGGIATDDPEERKLWNRLRNSYEFLSRVKSIPIVGGPLFGVLDTLQSIPAFYPIRDMSKSNFQVKLLGYLIDKGLCRGMLDRIQAKPHLPLLTSYLAPALAAEKAGYEKIYCIICDAEIARAWVSADPKTSRINYLAPCGRAVMRLKSYGVPEERIFLTGFPFPSELLGGKNLAVLKSDMARRLHCLDPNHRFWPLHRGHVGYFLGKNNYRFKKKRVFSITFAVGGAGAQRDIGYKIAKSYGEELRNGTMGLTLVAGVRREIKEYFDQVKAEVAPASDSLRVLYGETKEIYFEKFAETIRQTDILWTKPSELSFYCGLGIPIVLAPLIGSQEVFNQKWLLEIQAGIPQEDPQYANQWLKDLLHEGRLAESAWDGFLKARKMGLYKVMEVLETGSLAHESSPLKR